MNFGELLGGHLSKIWVNFTWGSEGVDSILSGIPTGIASYLKKQLIEHGKKDEKGEIHASATIGDILRIKAHGKKRGNSLTINAGLDLLPAGENLINAESLKVNLEAMEVLALSLLQDKELLECVQKGCHKAVYNEVTGNWDKLNPGVSEGVNFYNDSDLAVAIVTYFCTILEILVENSERSEVVTMDIPSFGKFSIELIKKKWALGFAPDKEFKSIVKCDALDDILND